MYLTNDELNEAIADLLEWFPISEELDEKAWGKGYLYRWRDPYGRKYFHLPNWSGSRDLMHGLIVTLSPAEWCYYHKSLKSIVAPQNIYATNIPEETRTRPLYEAEAAQQAHAWVMAKEYAAQLAEARAKLLEGKAGLD